MTDRRYRHYRRARDLLDTLHEEELAPQPRELLEDLAEDMLLNRESASAAVRKLRHDVEITVGELALVGVLPRPVAPELTRLLIGAGPPLRAPRTPADKAPSFS